MHTSQKTRLGLTSLAALGLAATTALTAQAATTVYTSRTLFTAALGAAAATAYTNTFTTPSNGQNASVPYSGNGFSYTAVGLGPQNNDVYVDGVQVASYFNNSNLLFNFSNNVYAVGGDFYTTDLNGAVVPTQNMELRLTDGTDVLFTSGADASDASAFRGFISTTPITQLANLVPEPFTPGFATTDNLTVAGSTQLNAVPEPSSVAAFAFTGLFAAGLMLKARKRQSAS